MLRDQGAKTLLKNRSVARLLKARKGAYVLNREELAEAPKYDGIWVVRTNTELDPKDVALRYKQLWMVERTFRTAKSLLDTRPVFHQTDDAIRGHMFCLLPRPDPPKGALRAPRAGRASGKLERHRARPPGRHRNPNRTGPQTPRRAQPHHRNRCRRLPRGRTPDPPRHPPTPPPHPTSRHPTPQETTHPRHPELHRNAVPRTLGTNRKSPHINEFQNQTVKDESEGPHRENWPAFPSLLPSRSSSDGPFAPLCGAVPVETPAFPPRAAGRRYTPRRLPPMRLSHHFGLTLREAPAGIEAESHRFLLRAGFIRQLGQGLYSYLPLAHRSITRIEDILAAGNEPDRRAGNDHAGRPSSRDLAPVGPLRRRGPRNGAVQGPEEQRPGPRHDPRRGGGRPLPDRDPLAPAAPAARLPHPDQVPGRPPPSGRAHPGTRVHDEGLLHPRPRRGRPGAAVPGPLRGLLPDLRKVRTAHDRGRFGRRDDGWKPGARVHVPHPSR